MDLTELIDQQRPSYMQPMYGNSMPMGMGMYGLNGPTMQYGMNPNITIADQGKGKAREADFEAAFAQIAESLGPKEAQTSRIEEVDDTVAALEEALKNATLKAEEDGEYGTDFQKYIHHSNDSMTAITYLSLFQSVGPTTEFRSSTSERRHW